MSQPDPIPLPPANTAEPPEPSPNEDHAPMLDVHPAHHAASTWRDFFIHIATIVLGLCIAVGIEQVVEFFHHRHQRHQLEEDIRDEAQHNIGRIQANQKNFAVYIAWYRDVLKAGREATPSAGFVTFVLPPRVNTALAVRPLDNVWVAAKTSGAIAVLPREKVETFGRVNNYAEQAEKAVDARAAALVAENAVLNRLGLTLSPGETVRLTPEDRDELMRAVALHAEGYRQLSIADATWEGSSDAVFHGVSSLDEMGPYISRAQAARPK